MNHHNHRESRIENPTLAHFRHFSSLFTNLPSTSVENPLQINLFMQNKPNFAKAQMNINVYSTMDYENKHNWTLGQNKSNSNPIKPCPERSRMGQFPKSPNERKCLCHKGLQKKRHFRSPKKQTQFKPNQSLSWAQSNGPILKRMNVNFCATLKGVK